MSRVKIKAEENYTWDSKTQDLVKEENSPRIGQIWHKRLKAFRLRKSKKTDFMIKVVPCETEAVTYGFWSHQKIDWKRFAHHFSAEVSTVIYEWTDHMGQCQEWTYNDSDSGELSLGEQFEWKPKVITFYKWDGHEFVYWKTEKNEYFRFNSIADDISENFEQ